VCGCRLCQVSCSLLYQGILIEIFLFKLLRRPREYIQLHRDTTVNQLLIQTSLENGVMKHSDSPLLRAIKFGRVIIIDEADKAAEHVVAVFRSLAGHGELSLPDGRRVRRQRERDSDVVVHPSFRLILLANRPGYRERRNLGDRRRSSY
jgi:von Willebrand factor A domain-containing protein 8